VLTGRSDYIARYRNRSIDTVQADTAEAVSNNTVSRDQMTDARRRPYLHSVRDTVADYGIGERQFTVPGFIDRAVTAGAGVPDNAVVEGDDSVAVNVDFFPTAGGGA